MRLVAAAYTATIKAIGDVTAINLIAAASIAGLVATIPQAEASASALAAADGVTDDATEFAAGKTADADAAIAASEVKASTWRGKIVEMNCIAAYARGGAVHADSIKTRFYSAPSVTLQS